MPVRGFFEPRKIEILERAAVPAAEKLINDTKGSSLLHFAIVVVIHLIFLHTVPVLPVDVERKGEMQI